ncbi:hypothetical protein NDU88_002720 [Pleurodeles waltl]|uniref:Uncharacterized protein n=1 Tax=Pleurodeles waltl TaxID=8319 RepID=A0AAV7NJF2_PLEWA|nr:hypothetical protein NDU88_002720 [Pleurodeles waltl]
MQGTPWGKANKENSARLQSARDASEFQAPWGRDKQTRLNAEPPRQNEAPESVHMCCTAPDNALTQSASHKII